METQIVHWNIRGYKANYKSLRTFLSDSQAMVMCLQETKMPLIPLDPPRGFSMYHKRGANDNEIDYGGVCILIKNSIGHKMLPLNTRLQAVATRCYIGRLYTICSIYLPPNNPVEMEDLEDLLSQLPQPYLLLGDFNSRSPMWGDSTTNPKGRIIENLINRTNCSILNSGSPTQLHMQNNSLTCIDLSICSPDAIQDFTWSLSDDLYNSDHYPVTLSSSDVSSGLCSSRFIFEKADWTKYITLAICEEDVASFPTIDEAV